MMKLSKIYTYTILGFIVGLAFPLSSTFFFSTYHQIDFFSTQTSVGWGLAILNFIPLLTGGLGFLLGKTKRKLDILSGLNANSTNQLLSMDADFQKFLKIKKTDNIISWSLQIGFILFTGIMASSLVFSILNQNNIKNLKEIVREKSETTAKLFSDQLEMQIMALDRMAQRFSESDQEFNSWIDDATHYYHDFNNIQSIGWANSSTKIEWIYPKSSFPLENLNLNQTSIINTAIRTSMNSKKGALSSIMALEDNSKIFFSIHPTFLNKKISGYMVYIYKTEDLFHKIFETNFHVSLLFDSQEIHKYGIRTREDLNQKIPIQVRNIEFTMHFGPTKKMVDSYLFQKIIYIIPILIMMITIILSYIFFTQSSSHNKLRHLLQETKSAKLAIDAVSIYAQTDQQGRITEVNDKFVEISGYSREELIGQDHRIINSSHHDKEFFKSLWSTISSGKTWEGEIKNRKKSGSFYWVATSIIPKFDKDGSINGFVAIRTDITDKKKHEENILEAHKITENSLEIKSQFLANMSHEIRTPLNGILGITDLIIDTTEDIHLSQKLKSIQNCGETLTQIIDDILDFSKLESGKVKIEKITFHIRKQVLQVINLLKARASERGNTVLLKVDPNLPQWVEGDPLRLRQIITNLLSNAIKFTKRGEIIIAITWVDEKFIQICIKDNGIGISKKSQEKLFESFSQADTSTTRKFGGSGLGLSICKGFLDLMNGSIWVESQEDTGSKFIFKIPSKQKSEPKIEPNHFEKNKDNIKSFQLKILVAEDNSINQAVIQGYLEKFGCLVTFANNGQEAIDIYDKEGFHAIFMDCHMPVKDGFAATVIIKEKHPDSLIIALTASSMVEDQVKCTKAGMDDFLSKPIQKTELLRILNKISSRIKNS